MYKLTYSQHHVATTKDFMTLEDALTEVYWMNEEEIGWPEILENLDTGEITHNNGPFDAPLLAMARRHIEALREKNRVGAE